MRRKPTRKPTRKLARSRSARRSPILILALALGLTLLAVWFKRVYTPKTPEIAQIVGQNGSVSLILSANQTELKPTEQATITLSYNSPAEHLTGIQAEITYNPAELELSGFTPASSFPTTILAPKVEGGKLTFVLGVAVGSNTGLTGQGQVLTFKAKALKLGTAQLALTDKSMTTTSEQTTNTLKEITGVALIVADTVASQQPSPTPTPTPSPSPKTPSPTPTTTPAPSQAVAATPAPTKKSISQAINNLVKPKSPSPKPSVLPSPSPLASFVPASPADFGKLNDIFTSPTPTIAPAATAPPTFFQKIFLGWKALLLRLFQ